VSDSGDEPPLPDIHVPDDLPDDPETAFLRGVEQTAGMVAGNASAFAQGAQRQRDADDGHGTDDGDESCPECGAELRDDFGGAICIKCGYSEDG